DAIPRRGSRLWWAALRALGTESQLFLSEPHDREARDSLQGPGGTSAKCRLRRARFPVRGSAAGDGGERARSRGGVARGRGFPEDFCRLRWRAIAFRLAIGLGD